MLKRGALPVKDGAEKTGNLNPAHGGIIKCLVTERVHIKMCWLRLDDP